MLRGYTKMTEAPLSPPARSTSPGSCRFCFHPCASNLRLGFMGKTKNRVQFLCNSCGSVHPKWMGKCPDCGTWDSLEEYKTPTADTRNPGASVRGSGMSDIMQGASPVSIMQID